MRRISLPAVKASLAAHFELFLTIAGVLLAMTLMLGELSQDQQSMALIFLIWLQGVILWAVHRHSRLQRRALIRKLRQNLNDLLNDRLATILSTAELTTRGVNTDGDGSEATVVAVIENLSSEFESLRAWEQRLQLTQA